MAKFDRRSGRFHDDDQESKIQSDVIWSSHQKLSPFTYGMSKAAMNTECEVVSSRRQRGRVFPRTKVGERSSQLPFLTVDLPDFYGSSRMMEVWNWVDLVDDYFRENSYPEHIQYKIATCKLKGDARVWLEILQNDRDLDGVSQINSWSELSDLLVCRYPHTTCLSEVCNKWISKLENVEKGTVSHANCSIKCPSEKESPKQSEDSSPSDSSHCLDVILETPIDETVEEINYILEPANCEENNNNDDLEESFVEEQSDKIVELKSAACSTKISLESEIDSNEEEEYKADCLVSNALTVKSDSSHVLLPIYGPDHIWNDLFYEFARVGCKHFDPGGIRQDMMPWFSLAKFSHGPVQIVEMEKHEEFVMEEGFDPNSMRLEHIALGVTQGQLHIDAKDVTVDQIGVEHEDTNASRAMNIGPQVMSVKLLDSKTLMLGSLANSLIGIRSFILVDEMLTLSFDPGGITNSGVLCPIRVHECRTNHALPRICDWNFDPGGQGQSRTSICRVLSCVMQGDFDDEIDQSKLVHKVVSMDCTKFQIRAKVLPILIKGLMNVDPQVDDSSYLINGLSLAKEGIIAGVLCPIQTTSLSSYLTISVEFVSYLFDPGGSAEPHTFGDHLCDVTVCMRLNGLKGTPGLKVNIAVSVWLQQEVKPKVPMAMFELIWTSTTLSTVQSRMFMPRSFLLHSLYVGFSSQMAHFLLFLNLESCCRNGNEMVGGISSHDGWWYHWYASVIIYILAKDDTSCMSFDANKKSTCIGPTSVKCENNVMRIGSSDGDPHVVKVLVFNSDLGGIQYLPIHLLHHKGVLQLQSCLLKKNVKQPGLRARCYLPTSLGRLRKDKARESAHAFISFDPGGVTYHSILDVDRLIIIALKELNLTKVRFIGTNLMNDPCATSCNVRPHCCVSYMLPYNFNFTRGRVIPGKGWNDVNNSRMFSMASRSIAGRNGQTAEPLKLFCKLVNGLDPPTYVKVYWMAIWILKGSLVDELFVWGDGLM